MGKHKIIKKYYSKEDDLFHIIKEISYFSKPYDFTYNDFEKFYIATNKDLSNADLLYYDFEDYDPKNYNLSNAIISSKTMIKLGNYDNTLYNLHLKNFETIEENKTNKIVKIEDRDLITEQIKYENGNNVIICYASDLHINHKLMNKFSKSLNEEELTRYFENIINEFKNSIPSFTLNSRILLIGDLSFNFETFKLFFTIYRKQISNNTFFILGNHELWDKNLIKKNKNVEKIIDDYRQFLLKFENPILLLENQVFFPYSEKYLWDKNDILNSSKEEIRKEFLHNGFCIFGGIGYAGLNSNFNYNNGIYRNAPLDRKDEIYRSNIVDKIHKKLKECISDKKVIFATHMPKSDWSNDEYVSNWVYLNGHTHKNVYIEDNTKTVYADNQIGYNNKPFTFKYFAIENYYNPFEEYNNGIYEITRDDYKDFYYGLGKRIDFNRRYEKLYMIKRNNIYCFLIQIKKYGTLKLLNGGSIKNIGEYSLQYLYDNLHKYSIAVKNFLAEYNNIQQKVSNFIKSIGGSGRIHGCIVDIDFFNHIYINPIDGKMTPYFAYSIVEKYVYENLVSLLKYNLPDLYINFVNSNDKQLMQTLSTELTESKKSKLVYDTEIYKISRIVNGLQYTLKYNIVRLWNDKFLDESNSINLGKEIVTSIINDN